LLKRFGNLRIVGIDRDKVILKKAQQRMEIFGERFSSYNINFTEASSLKHEAGETGFDCALIDLGISTFHYKEGKRGFSFSEKEKLDMRLDEKGTSVFEIINNCSYDELKEMFFKFGEEKFSREIARSIVKRRESGAIEYSDELARIIADSVPAKFRNRRINPATKVFQALRIAANDEIGNIRLGIPAVLSLLKTGGKLGIITFHSIEDRTVKEIFADLARDCVCPPKLPVCVCGKKREINILHRAIKPTEEEMRTNPSSRSAKLRIVEKLLQEGAVTGNGL
jgi:16S rRNA (cytosine1402-N4)-methyltransferase